MRLKINSSSATFGSVELHDLFRVTELDAGYFPQGQATESELFLDAPPFSGDRNLPLCASVLHTIEKQLAIIIPCMNEPEATFGGVILGIPHDCFLIVVSNSSLANYKAESIRFEEFCRSANRQGVMVHQQDTNLGRAFHTAGMSDLVHERLNGDARRDFQVRSGKGEAMMIGTAIAKIHGKKFVGFIDADNNVASTVHEYCKAYAAGLYYALSGNTANSQHTLAMVRIKWNSKPKVKDDTIVYETSGRSSRVVNEWMNRLLNALVGTNVPDDLIHTGNAGEHAMSIELAMQLRFATGYAVEPFQLIDAWERLARATPSDGLAMASDGSNHDAAITSTTLPRPIHILQIQTSSPHFHDTSKGDDHIMRMQVQGLSTIYHSSLTPECLKDELRRYMQVNLARAVDPSGEPEQMRHYQPLALMDWGVFEEKLQGGY